MADTIEVRAWGRPTQKQIDDAPADHLHIASVITECNTLHGRVLTIIDAAYVNEQQNKATKDLIRKAFREQMDLLVEMSTKTP